MNGGWANRWKRRRKEEGRKEINDGEWMDMVPVGAKNESVRVIMIGECVGT